MYIKPNLDALKLEVNGFEIISAIGEGGFKTVYRIEKSGLTEALKVAFIPNDENNADVILENQQRIMREIGILHSCKSATIVKLGSIQPKFVNIDTNMYMVYSEELLLGSSLRSKIGIHTPIFASLQSIAVNVLHAISELSSMNIIHRDIKPDNIMDTGLPERPFVLLDLGIAFQQGGTILTRNRDGLPPGTFYYLAPEMFDANFRQNLDYRADLYALGLTLYEYAVGSNPYMRNAKSMGDTIYRIANINPPRLESIRKDLPKDFCRIVDQCIAKRPALRPANLSSLIRRVEEIK